MVVLPVFQTNKISASPTAYAIGRMSIADPHDIFYGVATSDQETRRHRLRRTRQIAQSPTSIEDDFDRHAIARQKVEFDLRWAHAKASTLPVSSSTSPFPIGYRTNSDGRALPSEKAARQYAVLSAIRLRAELKATSIDSKKVSHGSAAWDNHSLHLFSAFCGSYRWNAVTE